MPTDDETFAYIGRKACGCVVFAAVDHPHMVKKPLFQRHLAADIKRAIDEGLTIERVTVSEARPQLVTRCPHVAPAVDTRQAALL